MQKTIILLSTCLLIAHLSFSQQTDSIKRSLQLKGAVTVTNKGISFVPTFRWENQLQFLISQWEEENFFLSQNYDSH
jgi:hypothetical protein